MTSHWQINFVKIEQKNYLETVYLGSIGYQNVKGGHFGSKNKTEKVEVI